jgi:hypothetical protein
MPVKFTFARLLLLAIVLLVSLGQISAHRSATRFGSSSRAAAIAEDTEVEAEEAEEIEELERQTCCSKMPGTKKNCNHKC